jgi:hypothetical protein
MNVASITSRRAGLAGWDRVLAASATMTATLDLLERRGWIRRGPTPPTGAAS